MGKKTQKLRLSPEAWTLEELEKIQGFRERALDSGEEYANMNAWENILQVCGMSKNEFWDMTPVEYLEATKKVRFEGKIKRHFQKKVINGVTFIAFEEGEKFKIKAPQMAAIEKIAKSKNGVTFAEIMAGLLRRENETREDQITTVNINEKATILKSMNAAEALPFLASWGNVCAEVYKRSLKNVTE